MQGGRGGPLPFLHQPLHPLATVEGWSLGGRIIIAEGAASMEREVKTRVCLQISFTQCFQLPV